MAAVQGLGRGNQRQYVFGGAACHSEARIDRGEIDREHQRQLAAGVFHQSTCLQQELLDSLPLPPGDNFVLVLNHRRRKERVLFTNVAGSRIL